MPKIHELRPTMLQVTMFGGAVLDIVNAILQQIEVPNSPHAVARIDPPALCFRL